jgi:hypothetical protein
VLAAGSEAAVRVRVGETAGPKDIRDLVEIRGKALRERPDGTGDHPGELAGSLSGLSVGVSLDPTG